MGIWLGTVCSCELNVCVNVCVYMCDRRNHSYHSLIEEGVLLLLTVGVPLGWNDGIVVGEPVVGV